MSENFVESGLSAEQAEAVGEGEAIMNKQQHKDACSYSVEVAKQFITLAAAGVAFIVGLVIAGNAPTFGTVVATLLMLGASILLGLLYLMLVVGNIHKNDDYNVYSGKRFIAGLQILFFLAATSVLGLHVYRRVSAPLTAVNVVPLEVVANGRTVRYVVPTSKSVTVTLQPSGEMQLTVAK